MKNTMITEVVSASDVSEEPPHLDWHWQIRNRVTSLAKLKEHLPLLKAEEAVSKNKGMIFPFSVTPYYLTLLSRLGPDSPLRKTVVPSVDEFTVSDGDRIDPLGEHEDTAAPGLVHRYPDRVLFLVTEFCSVYCRYCTRSRIVGKKEGSFMQRRDRWSRALDYIERHKEVRDVLLSGGDPLTLEDFDIEWLLNRLYSIPHVEIVRIGTKVPVVLPMRITDGLIEILKRYRPLWMSIHFSHPDELTPETEAACGKLADAGIPLGSQTVLLKGINDSAETLKTLYHGLLRMRVRPYYLYQCDPVVGTSHFRTSVKTGLDLMEQLRGHTSGYALPTYVIDAPGGGGKVPLLYDHIAGRENGDLLLINYENKIYRYPDPEGKIVSSMKGGIQ